MSIGFADNEIKKILEARGENYFDKFKEFDYVANIGSPRGGGIKTNSKGTCYIADATDLDDILNLYVLRERAYEKNVSDDDVMDIKQAIVKIFTYGAYYISRNCDGEVDLIVPIMPTGTRKKCMACHFVDPCVLNNNYGSCARIVGIMHSIESAMVKDLGVETAMLVVTVKERDKFMNKVLGEVVGEGNYVIATIFRMYPFNTTVNWDKLRSFRSKKQQKKYMNQVSDAFEQALESVFTRWAFVGDDEVVNLDEIVEAEVE